MDKLTKLIKDDMKPALGVTEPGAIAFATAKAVSYVPGEIRKIELSLNSGMYKNAFTCGIPNSEMVGNDMAAALGAVGGDASLGLEALAKISPADNLKAKQLVDEGKVKVNLSGITSEIFIKAAVETSAGSASVTIEHSHTAIVEIMVNGKVEFQAEAARAGQKTAAPLIHSYTLEQILKYVESVDFEEIKFINEAYRVNLELFEEGLSSPRTSFVKQFFKDNGNQRVSGDEVTTAQLLCNGGIEARVLGLEKAAMSITGSGAHGIIATLPLYAVSQVNKLGEEKLLRATALSYLICMFIKEYSGKLSAFCGCAVAAGTGMACAMAWLKGAGKEQITLVINNMASSITGMICDGGNQGCVMKGIAAVDTAFRASHMALSNVGVSCQHGINAATPEATMRYIGLIASPGMVGTEKTILDIMEEKQAAGAA